LFGRQRVELVTEFDEAFRFGIATRRPPAEPQKTKQGQILFLPGCDAEQTLARRRLNL
jgi:hypothetical protein